MSNRNQDFHGRSDKRRAQLTAREAEQRAEQRRFEELAMMQKPHAGNGDLSRVKAELAAHAGRLLVIETELAQGLHPAPARRVDYMARWLGALALACSMAALVLAMRGRLF